MIVIWILCCLKIVSSISDDCFKEAYFSSKTPYKIIENLNIDVEKPHPSCKAVHINMVHRHANRYPSAKDIRNIKKAEGKINIAVETLQSDVNITLPWTCPFNEKQDKLLSPVGENEIYQIGRRLKQRFPTIFSNSYTPLDYSFVSSCKLRCTHSANALAAGLFDGSGSLGKCRFQPVAVQTNPCDNDPVLRFFELCRKYRSDVVKSPKAMKEHHDFGEGPEMQIVLAKVKKRLGLSESNINAKDVSALYIACAYDIGMFNGTKSNGICALFDDHDIRVLEYWFDLKHFYKRSAGHKITFESSCPLLNDIVQTLKNAKSGIGYRGVFRSAHAETIMPLYALLGIYIGEHKPRADNFKEMRDRHFRAACLSPFSGNIYFVLYQCDDNQYKIQMFLNERIAHIPCCKEKYSCDFDVFLKCYEKVAEDCVFHQMCEIEDIPRKEKQEL